LTGAAVVPANRALVFKSVGMGWEDLVIARAVIAAAEADS
jgi:ornithine cyclodeaminase/alanine dehydrogenase-like protein (mu-crystallin family)